MIRILIMCATGIATSTVIRQKVQTWLNEKGYDKITKIYQSKIADEMGKLKNYDIVISSTITSKSERDDIISAVPLLTGVGIEAVFNELERQIKEFQDKQ